MFQTIVGALLPAVITILLGYLAARHHDFGAKDVPILNRMVISYALPISLFVGTVSSPRAALLKDVPLAVVLFIAIVGLYGAVLLACRYMFHFSLGRSALAAMIAAVPNVAFVGSSVLGYLYGAAGAVPVAIGSIIYNVTAVPLTIIILSLDSTARAVQTKSLPARAAAPSASPVAPPRRDVVKSILETLKQPIIWLPLLGVLMVLLGIHVATPIDRALALLGQTSSGLALFTVGIILTAYRVKVDGFVLVLACIKNIVQPGLVWISLHLLHYSNPLLSQAVVTTALPVLTIVPMLSLQYGVAEREAASALFISMVGSLITLGAFIALTGR